MLNRQLLIMAAAAGLAACAKPAADADGNPADAATQVGVSTSGVVGQTLNAPGNYVRNLAGGLEKAKGVSEMVNKSAAEREAQAEQYGGNQ